MNDLKEKSGLAQSMADNSTRPPVASVTVKTRVNDLLIAQGFLPGLTLTADSGAVFSKAFWESNHLTSVILKMGSEPSSPKWITIQGSATGHPNTCFEAPIFAPDGKTIYYNFSNNTVAVDSMTEEVRVFCQNSPSDGKYVVIRYGFVDDRGHNSAVEYGTRIFYA